MNLAQLAGLLQGKVAIEFIQKLICASLKKRPARTISPSITTMSGGKGAVGATLTWEYQVRSKGVMICPIRLTVMVSQVKMSVF